MLDPDQKVAIIGAGPVGLTMARLLQQRGIEVAVFERDKNDKARIWGGTLDLHEHSGKKAMEKAGLLQRYFDLAEPMARTIVDATSEAVLFTSGSNVESPEINRNNLRMMLMDSLLPNTVVWDSRCVGLEAVDRKWVIHFEHQPDVAADVVIGANGGSSTVRKMLTGAEAEYTGTYVIQGEVTQPEINCPGFFQLTSRNILMTSSNGNMFVANPNNNHALTYNLTFRKPESWLQDDHLDVNQPERVVQYLLRNFSTWGSSFKELFRATGSFVGLPIRKVSLDKPWKGERPLPITLIGDAAHVMPPFAGEGVNTGMLDALVLSENLLSNRFQTIEAAIYDYEQQMFLYASAAQEMSSRNEIAMHQADFSFVSMFKR